MAALSFTVYLVPGMWGAPLKALSGVLPPLHSQDYVLGAKKSVAIEKTAVKYTDILHCPNNLDCFFDYEEGMAHAKKVNKPVLLDFTGHSCANCRKMEASVWTDARVDAKLRNDYVLISLYVDDKTELSESDKFVTKTGKSINTVGQKWSYFQESKYHTNSQPYYVPLNHKGEQLVTPRGYDENIESYLKFLDEGIANFK
jgi:thiol:disulfide interchange protein DsbD